MTRRGVRLLALAVLAAAVVPLALAVRWGGQAKLKGSRFHPWPDAVEYAAEAQSLARSGQAYLQIGPYRVRPRFPPGWPLLLAPAVRLGVAGQDLWRITGVFGALLAWLVGAVAMAATAALGPPHPTPLSSPGEGEKKGLVGEGAALFAGLLAGGLWALAPLGVDLGQTLMSDEPTALVCLLSLLLSGAAFLRPEKRGAGVLALAGGLAFGLAATMRSIAAALLLVPLALFLLGGLRRRSLRPRLLAWGVGAAVFPAVTMVVLARSGWPVLQWSGYSFWMPGRFGHLASAFNPRFVLRPDAAFPQEGVGPISHLELAARVLLGIPGMRSIRYLGYLWPIAGWLAAFPLARIARRRFPETARWTALALLVWTLAHVAVFTLYFYPSARFYLGPLALCTVLLATACGVGLAGPGTRLRLASAGVALLAAALALQAFADFRREPPPDLDTGRTRARFHRWLALGDERRAERVMPFDPVHAQALGLLTPEVVAQIHEWGLLPDTVHVRRLRANGYLAGRELESSRR